MVLLIFSVRGYKGHHELVGPLQTTVIPKPGDLVVPGLASSIPLAVGRLVQRKMAHPQEPEERHCSGAEGWAVGEMA